MGLPLRIAVPAFVAVAALFLAVMGYFVKEGLGNSGAALGRVSPGTQGAAAPPPAALQTDAPGTYAVPQTGTGPAGEAAGLPGRQVGGGGPPAPVLAALDALRERLKTNPNDLAALVGLADMEFDAAKFDRAIPYYRRALVLDPGNPDVRTDFATALHQTGHDLEALAELEAVVKARPDFAPALYNRAVVLRAIGRRSDAQAAFGRFVRTFPNDPRAADARASLQELGG